MGAATILMVLGVVMMGIILVAPVGFVTPPLFYNTTASLPRGFYYVVVEETLSMGDIVRSCAPAEVASFALHRGYLQKGSCSGGTAPIGKMVVAMAGDTVFVRSEGVRVGKRLLRHSKPLKRDSHGRPIEAAMGRYVLGTDECFMLSMHIKGSYDSRYFGPVTCTAPYHVLHATIPQARRQLSLLRRAARE